MAKTKLAPLHVVAPEPEIIKLDLGCGKTTPDGWIGIDSIDFGQAFTGDLAKTPWRFKISSGKEIVTVEEDEDETGIWRFPADSISEVRSSHFVEHLTWEERVPFFNELYRVMKVGATAQIVTPHWSHACFYGDPTHKAPLSEWYVNYLNKNWRDSQAPHTAYTCDFDFVIAGSWDVRLNGRNPEFAQMAMGQQINAWRDLICTLTKRP